MIVLKISDLYDIIREFDDNPELVSDKIEYYNGDKLEVIRGDYDE